MTVTRIPIPADPLEVFEQVQDEPFPVLLESAARDDRFGRVSIVAWNPTRVLLLEGERLTLHEAGTERRLRGDPFEAVERLARDLPAVEDVPFPGGAIGWIGYDLNRYVERLPQRGRRAVDLPELFLGVYNSAVCVDHRAGRAWRVDPEPTSPPALDPEAYRRRFGDPVRSGSFAGAPVSNVSREVYLRAVRRAHEHILDGDVYEVNLSQRFSLPARAPAPELYRRLRSASPAWYASAFTLGSRCVVGSSPEEFLTRRGASVRTRPIKGTRPRGSDPGEDRRLAEELWESAKDDAELAMIVDLSRNDLGRVCEYGSVSVTVPKELEHHATVHHLSATVEGTLESDVGTARLLRALFPGGSVTGAPKIRAMEIIDELEPDRRGIYCGALGFFTRDTVDLSMVIRTALFDGSRLHFQVGGAITADSVPADEYEETLAKARGFRRAVQGRSVAGVGASAAAHAEGSSQPAAGEENRA